MNQKQREELANGGETTFWKRLSLNGLFRRSSMQALLGAVSGGGAWIVWALGSAYAGPHEKTVRNTSFALMLVLSGFAGWAMTHDFRKRVMGLDEDGKPI